MNIEEHYRKRHIPKPPKRWKRKRIPLTDPYALTREYPKRPDKKTPKSDPYEQPY
jgi:hypothetical protein